MSAATFVRLEVESLDVESFETHGSYAGTLVLDSAPDHDPLVDSRAAGCTEPIRVCSGTGWTIDYECGTGVECVPFGP
jgi:hypothetical protein